MPTAAAAAAAAATVATSAAKIVKFDFTHKFRTVRGTTGFSVATLTATFDHDLLLNATSVDQLSYAADPASTDLICLNSNVCDRLPWMSTRLNSAITLSCINSGGDKVLVDSFWSSAPPPMRVWSSDSRPPSFLIPMAGLRDGVTALFHSLGLVFAPEIARSKRSISVLLFLTLSQVDGPIPLRRFGLTPYDLPSCQIRINGTAGSLFSSADRRPIMAESTFPATLYSPPCNYLEFRKVSGELRRAIDSANISDWRELERAPWSIAAHAASDTFWGCEMQANDLVNGTVTSKPYNISACFWVPSAPQWGGDACCNLTLTYTTCCSQRTLETRHEVISTETPADSAALKKCRFPDLLKPALVDMGTILNWSEDRNTGCSAQISDNVNPVIFASFSAFVKVCTSRLFPGGVAPTPSVLLSYNLDYRECSTADDCGKGVSCFDGICRPPVSSVLIDELYVQCLLDEMPTLVRRFFEIELKLPAGTSDELFSSSFRAEMMVPNCVGGLKAWVLRHDYSIDPPRFITADRAKCEGYEVCSQGFVTDVLDQSSCPSIDATGRTGFCAQCRDGGPPCYMPYFEYPGCWLTGGTEAQCSQTSGQWSAWLKGCWLPNVTTIDQCVPDFCPAWDRSDVVHTVTACNRRLCYSPDINETACNNVAATPANLSCTNDNSGTATPFNAILKQWLPTFRRGKGLCHHPSLVTKSSCLANGKLWHDPKIWYHGVLDSPEKCAAGMCSNQNLLLSFTNASTCATRSDCSVGCRSCNTFKTFLNQVCYLNCSTPLVCLLQNARFDRDTSLCVFDLNRADCLARNFTFAACADIPLDQCAKCDPLKPELGCGHLKPVEAKFLKCGVPEVAYECPDQASCENAGSCGAPLLFSNDALSSSYCGYDTFGFYPDANCRGVCSRPFTVSATGDAECIGSGNVSYTAFGCTDATYRSEAECNAVDGYRWVLPPQDLASCTALAGSACFEQGRTRPTQKNEQQCAACSQNGTNTYKPAIPWKRGVWNPAFMDRTYQWIPLGPVKPLRWGRALNTTRFFQTLQNMAANRMGPFVTTELLCRFNTLASALAPISCSCDSAGPTTCFSGTVTQVIVGAPRFCTGIADFVRMGATSLRVHEDTIPYELGCLTFQVALVGALQFVRDDDTLSSTQIQSLQRVGGPHSVVVNDFGVTVGQLSSDGVQISWGGAVLSLSAAVTVCVDPGQVVLESDTFTEADIAQLVTGDSGAASSASFLPQETMVSFSSEGQLCFDTTHAGTYFVIHRIPSWRDARQSSLSNSLLAVRVLLGLEAGAFALLCLFAIASFLFALRCGPGVWYYLSPQKVLLVFILLFAALRCVWLSLNSSEDTSSVSVVGQSILSELPIFCVYSIFTTLIILWTRTTGASLGRKHGTVKLVVPMVAVNVLLYLFYIAMLIAFSLAPPASRDGIALAYRIVLAAVSMATVIAFWMSGARLLILLRKWDESGKARRWHTTVVVCLTSLCLLMQIAFLLAGAFVESTAKTTFAWVVVILYYPLGELVPFSVLCHLLYGNVWRHHAATKEERSLAASTTSPRPSTVESARPSLGNGSSVSCHSMDSQRKHSTSHKQSL